jgi:hypothetical protein
MRFGISSSGRSWVSFGPLGMLVYAVFVAAYVVVLVAVFLVIVLPFKVAVALYEAAQRRKAAAR